MKRLLIVLTSSSLLLAACAPTVKSERKRNAFHTAGADQNAELPDDDLNPIEETPPSIDPVEEPMEEPIEAPIKTPPAPPPAWDNGVSGPISQALNAALKGVGAGKTYFDVYSYRWRVARTSIRVDGDTITIEGKFERRSYLGLLNDKVTYEFVYVNGQLERHDIYTKESPSPLMVLGPIASIIGAYYGIPIPADAVNKVAGQIETIAVGDWQGAAQKLAFRIGMAGYLEALAQSGAI